MTPSSHMDGIIARFLGPEAATGGPHALLGLAAGASTHFEILNARDRQLRRVDLHAEGATPAADEVRLALHAAAAQLLNPSVREHLRASGLAERRRAAMLGLERDVVMMLGMYGGWTRRSLPRLVALAHARGLRANDVAQAVRSIAQRRARPKPVVARSGAACVPVGGASPQVVARHQRAGLIIGIVAICSILAAGVVIRVALEPGSRRGDEVAAMPVPRDRTPSTIVLAPEKVADEQVRPSAQAPPEAERTEVLPLLERAISLTSADPRQAEQLGVEAVRGLSRHWLEFDAAQRARSQDAVLELMYRLGGSSMSTRPMLEAVGAGAELLRPERAMTGGDDVARAAWSIGMLTRLRRESDISAQAQMLIDRWLGSALVGVRPAQASFAEGAIAALQAMAPALAGHDPGDPGAWRAWARGVVVLTESDAGRRAILLAQGGERVLVSRLGPQRSSGVFEAIGAVIDAMPWQTAESRQWFVRQFDNRDVNTPALSAATQALVARGGVENIDPTMVLPANASDLARRALRDRYVDAWNISEPGSDTEVLERLERALAELDAGLTRTSTGDQMLRSAVGYARLNAAAAARWQGDGGVAIQMLEHYRVPDSALSRAGRGPDLSDGSDGNWAERYLQQGANIDRRLELLGELRSRGGSRLGPIDAEVVVAEALRGSGRGVRELARAVVEQYGSSPAVVNALLEEAPRIPPIPSMSNLVSGITLSPLPDRNSPQWRAAVRRALVERMLELLSAEGDTAAIDLLASLLDDAYMERASANRAVSPSGNGPSQSCERSAMQMRARWTQLAERLPPARLNITLSEVERRRTGRMALARGLVQQFIVEQIALAETMALVVAAERPDLSVSVQGVLDQLDADVQRSNHVFEQVARAERAMVELWELRLGLVVGGGSG
ncbi:MAG: hypothetical protein KJZ65_04290 [Phycisphaerales bacterium]|nr:hypothetical protein [Phycisphaerales bacterium]